MRKKKKKKKKKKKGRKVRKRSTELRSSQEHLRSFECIRDVEAKRELKKREIIDRKKGFLCVCTMDTLYSGGALEARRL